jgi:class 3 adenylate cyclase
MHETCPSTLFFKSLREKFTAKLSTYSAAKTSKCTMSCFAGRMEEKVLKKLAKDRAVREEITRGIVKHLTILFADIRGFTTRTADMEPDRIVRLLDIFIPEMLQIIIRRHKGTVDKLLGDGIMALFGHPYGTGDDIIQALYSAVDMHQAAAALEQALLAGGYDPIEIGVGINSGSVLICEVGDDNYRESTVIGSPVNMAAKMEDVAKSREIALPESIIPLVEEKKPDIVRYFRRKGHHHGVDTVTFDWIGFLEAGQKEIADWEI